MIGDGYFQLRGQIGTSLYALSKLARELATPETTLASLQALQTSLREPFCFLTVGEPGAGKSALLNALFGRDFAGEPDLSGRTVTYRHGNEAHNEPAADGSLEARRPYVFLRDFALVELPGFGDPDLFSQLLPAAELVLIVLPLESDPTATLDFLALFERSVLRRCVCVASHSDAVSNHEGPHLIKRLRHAMHTRLGDTCPLFPVSLQTGSGLQNLEHYIAIETIFSPARCQKLRGICAAGRTILEEVGAPARAELLTVESEEQRLEEERQGLAARRDQSLRTAGGALWSLTRLFEAAHSHGARMLRRKLTMGGIWSDPPEWWPQFHTEVETRLHESINRNLAWAFGQFEIDLQVACQQHGEILRRLGLEHRGILAHDRADLFLRLAGDLAACDRDGVTTEYLQRACAAARTMLRLPAFAALGAAAILCGALAAGRFVPGVAALTALTATVLLIVLALLRANVLEALRRLMAQRREQVLARFEDELRAELDRFYGGLTRDFQPLAEAHIQRRALLAPTFERLEQFERLFERCVADIASRKPSKPLAEEIAADAGQRGGTLDAKARSARLT